MEGLDKVKKDEMLKGNEYNGIVINKIQQDKQGRDYEIQVKDVDNKVEWFVYYNNTNEFVSIPSVMDNIREICEFNDNEFKNNKDSKLLDLNYMVENTEGKKFFLEYKVKKDEEVSSRDCQCLEFKLIYPDNKEFNISYDDSQQQAFKKWTASGFHKGKDQFLDGTWFFKEGFGRDIYFNGTFEFKAPNKKFQITGTFYIDNNHGPRKFNSTDPSLWNQYNNIKMTPAINNDASYNTHEISISDDGQECMMLRYSGTLNDFSYISGLDYRNGTFAFKHYTFVGSALNQLLRKRLESNTIIDDGNVIYFRGTMHGIPPKRDTADGDMVLMYDRTGEVQLKIVDAIHTSENMIVSKRIDVFYTSRQYREVTQSFQSVDGSRQLHFNGRTIGDILWGDLIVYTRNNRGKVITKKYQNLMLDGKDFDFGKVTSYTKWSKIGYYRSSNNVFFSDSLLRTKHKHLVPNQRINIFNGTGDAMYFVEYEESIYSKLSGDFVNNKLINGQLIIYYPKQTTYRVENGKIIPNTNNPNQNVFLLRSGRDSVLVDCFFNPVQQFKVFTNLPLDNIDVKILSKVEEGVHPEQYIKVTYEANIKDTENELKDVEWSDFKPQGTMYIKKNIRTVNRFKQRTALILNEEMMPISFPRNSRRYQVFDKYDVLYPDDALLSKHVNELSIFLISDSIENDIKEHKEKKKKERLTEVMVRKEEDIKKQEIEPSIVRKKPQKRKFASIKDLEKKVEISRIKVVKEEKLDEIKEERVEEKPKEFIKPKPKKSSRFGGVKVLDLEKKVEMPRLKQKLESLQNIQFMREPDFK